MKTLGWLGVLLVVAVTVAVVVVPVVIIQPFSPQTADGVALSYLLRQSSVYVTTAAAIFLIAIFIARWRRTRWFARCVLILLTGVTLVTAWFARQNHFEWMFRPVDARFVQAGEATGVSPDEQVIGVTLGADAMAFPIRRIGYHHIVNVTLGDQPIVATY